MTENMAARGEGPAGLVAKWRADAAKGKAKAAKLKLPTQDTKELTEYDTAMEHCATELEAALEAAAPPSTAHELWESAKQRERLAMKIAEDLMAQNMLDVPCKVALHVINAALATPSPQAPPEIEAIDDRAKVERALNALDHLCDMWAEEVDLERIVKAISGNPDKVRALLRQSWIEGAYRGRTSHVDYPQPVSPAATQEPAGSGADLRNRVLDEAAKAIEAADCLPNCSAVMHDDSCPYAFPAEAVRKLKRFDDDEAGGLPRKVGEDGAQTFEQWWQAEGVHMVRTTHRTGYELMREAWNAARPSSVPVGEPEPTCICAQGVTKCPRHGEQPAQREPCPLCGAPLGYCAQGEYCTKGDCKYVA